MDRRVSKIIRRTHMYLALFLTPWVVVYSLSSLVINHFPLVRSLYGDNLNKFELVGERDYDGVFSADAEPAAVARQILDELDLAGSFYVQGNLSQKQMTINRGSSFAAHRITYFPKEQRLKIERSDFQMPTFLNRVHFRHGYDQPYLASDAWAVIVDLVVLSFVLWVATGIWMWWEIKPARKWGAVFGALGLGIFALLLFTI